MYNAYVPVGERATLKMFVPLNNSMKVGIFVVIAVWLGAAGSYGQAKQHYRAGAVKDQHKVVLHLNASTVSCRIQPTYSMDAVHVFGYPEATDFNPVRQDRSVLNHQEITLNFEESPTETFSSSLSARVFDGFDEAPDKPWYVYLSRNTPFDLMLNYGMGSSSVDLSGLAIEKLKINTGSAQIRVSFDGNVPNQTTMDTLQAKIDLGVLELDKIDMAKAQEVIANVGFGKLLMYLTKDCKKSSHITASVGAGTLEVTFEDTNVPVIIHLNKSPLCHVSMLKAFRKIAPETFVNSAYREDAPNLVSFDIDVSMGHVIFK